MKNKLKLILILSIVLLGVYFCIPTIYVKNLQNKNNYIKMSKIVENKKIYNLLDMIDITLENNYNIMLDDVYFDDLTNFKIYIDKYNNDKEYQLKININGVTTIYIIHQNESIRKLELVEEGKNNVTVQFFCNRKMVKELHKVVYYCKSYNKQFLDELENNGVTVHYRYGNFEKVNKSGPFLKRLGEKYVRGDFYHNIFCAKSEINEKKEYDKWVSEVNDAGIKILAVIDGDKGESNRIDSDLKLENSVNQLENVNKRYPFIVEYEIINEPNFRYITDEQINWYIDLVAKISEKYDNKFKLNIASTNNNKEQNTNSFITSEDFYKRLLKFDNYIGSNNYSLHPYSFTGVEELKRKIDRHCKILNEYGGFYYLNITEYGVDSKKNTEEEQADIDIKQSVILEDKINLRILYNLWSTAVNDDSSEQFGLLTNDYKPKKSYYAMKNYYENTNGAEYIGSIEDIDHRLEFHIYDKDGSPVAICWLKNSGDVISLNYDGFIAYDVYGKEIENTNGVLEVTTSPVYLKNIDRVNFYKAIANTASREYNKFLNNYSEQLNSCTSMIRIQSRVNELKSYMESLNNGQEVLENEAITKMKEHFNLGNLILDAYQRGELQVEEVKVSSMLDSLNTIGYAFEDLVTITAENVQNVNLDATNLRIESFNGKINTNPDVEVIYPKKIAEFAKDYYEKSSYINSVIETNPIKNGLIISKGLHAYYLIGWANAFADINLQYSNISVTYSTEGLTNQDVIAILNGSSEVEMISESSHTFTENGSFTFIYRLYGVEKSVSITVDWIDKTYPEFVGINDRFDEMEPVTINVVDENLESVVATKDGQAIQFNNGDTLIEVGSYVVTATDKAGNTVIAEFRIVDYIESNKEYYISPDGNGDGLSKNSPMNVSDASKIRYYAGDKILFKSGERYNIDLNWYMMGAMEKNVTISSYDDGDMPVINGSIELVSNLNISGIRFTNSSESCLITNQMYNENIAVFDCVFENIDDTAIFLNKQVSNININNCIFRNCGKSGIAIKNDDKSFIAQNVLIRDNMFIGMDNMIAISGDFADESFENVQVCDNYFVNQKGDNAIISFGSIVDTKFDVKLFNNFYYNFEAGYSADKRYMEALKNNLVSENNTWYAVKNSRILNESVEFEKLHNDYNIENNSKFVVMNPLGYQISLIEVIASDSYDKNEVIAYILETIRMSSENKKVEDIDVETGAVTVTSGYEAFLGSKVGSGAELTEKNSQEKIEDVTIAEVDIPLAGWKRIAFGIVAIELVGAIVSGVKKAKYWKDENSR